jgi:hypothetical protein
LALPAVRGSREATILLRSMQVHPCSSPPHMNMRKRAELLFFGRSTTPLRLESQNSLLLTCSQEAVLLQPYPETWKDLVGSRGECFACGSVQKVHASFPTILLAPCTLEHDGPRYSPTSSGLALVPCGLFRGTPLCYATHRSRPSSSRPARGSRYGCSMGAMIEFSHNKYSSSSYVSSRQPPVLCAVISILSSPLSYPSCVPCAHTQRSAPPSHRSYEAGSRVHFEKVLRPANFRGSSYTP